jgi:hypothetical protein
VGNKHKRSLKPQTRGYFALSAMNTLPVWETFPSGTEISYRGGHLEPWNAHSKATSCSPTFPDYLLKDIR